MSDNDWGRCLIFTLDQEGGWSDRADDKGGPTMAGITLGTFARWRRAHGQPEPTKDDLRNIDDATVEAIYYNWYWLPSGADDMVWPVNLAVFDLAVNGGVGRSDQAVAEVGLDFAALMEWRLAWYMRLDDWPIFGAGWARRVRMLFDYVWNYEETESMARISEEAKKLNIEVVPATPNAAGQVYRIWDVWTTRNGSWEVGNTPGGLPQWARDTYLKPWGAPDYFDDGGGDHHMFGGVYDEAARAMKNNSVIHYWTWTDNNNHVDMPCKAKSGWANVEMWNHFNPDDPDEPQGAWAWQLKSDIPADTIKGGGLPGNWHVSYFASWVLASDVITPPPTDDLEERVDALELWARAMSAEYPGGPQYD